MERDLTQEKQERKSEITYFLNRFK
jgi:hypothetical protein